MIKVKIEGTNKVLQALIKASKKYKNMPDVMVGFTQRYAVYVHEDLQARHPVGQAKFLESAARALMPTVGKYIASLVKQGMSIIKAALIGGLQIQREAQKRCPVDTGALRASAFTAETSQVEQVASAAFAKSEAMRRKK